MKYLMITNKPSRAHYAVLHGVGQVFIDMETLGKEERQKDRGAVFNNHSLSDIKEVCIHLASPQEHVLVRVNPFNPKTFQELDQVLVNPVQTIMLPFFKTLSEIKQVREYIGTRAKLCLLFETIDSLELVEEVIDSKLCDQIHFGLNDLSIELGHKCIFKVLYNERFLKAVEVVREKSFEFGIGGVGKVGLHEIPAEMLLIKYISLGSSYVILSRAFNSEDIWKDGVETFKAELEKLNSIAASFSGMNKQLIDNNNSKLHEILLTKI